MVEIIQRANPQVLEEIERGFKPIEVREYDAGMMELVELGLISLGTLVGPMRVMVVFAVDRTDANRIKKLASIMGMATGAMTVSVPCVGEVEWAQVQEAFEYRKTQLASREAAKMVRLAAWQESMETQLPLVADEMERQKTAASTFGYGGHLQRSNQ